MLIWWQKIHSQPYSLSPLKSLLVNGTTCLREPYQQYHLRWLDFWGTREFVYSNRLLLGFPSSATSTEIIKTFWAGAGGRCWHIESYPKVISDTQTVGSLDLSRNLSDSCAYSRFLDQAKTNSLFDSVESGWRVVASWLLYPFGGSVITECLGWELDWKCQLTIS